MINPEDQIPLDDAEDSDKEDQMSQQDIHSNGLEEERIPPAEDDYPNTDHLRQASDASEAAYTLDVDKGIAPKAKKVETQNFASLQSFCLCRVLSGNPAQSD